MGAVAYPGFQREGCLRSGPIHKVGGRGGGRASGPIYEKWGGGGGGGGGRALQVRYTKSGGGAIPLQVRYLWTHRKYLHVPTYVLPRYTSHERANVPAKINLL